MRLVILGGGGFRVPLVYRGLARLAELDVSEVVLADVDAARLAVIERVIAAEAGPPVRLTTSMTEAVTGADFVFSAIRVGGAAGRVRDERRALERGVLGQETVGAGGLAYGLRTLPVALDLARDIAERAPQAWLINFTNPAGLLTEALREVLGERVIGICDSPAGLVSRACRALGVPESSVVADYLGINHLGWLRGLHQGSDRRTEDLLPDLLDDPVRLESFEEGRLFGPELVRALAAIPNEYLHFYYRHAESLAAVAGGPTRGEVLAAQQAAFYSAAAITPERAPALWEATRLRREQSYLAEARSSERDEADLAGGGYERVALRVMLALAGGPAQRLIVNTANASAVPQLPDDLVLELPCEVTGTGARPLPVRPPTLHQLGLIGSVRAAERAVIEAVRTGSRAAAEQAFTIHPLVASQTLARQLLADLLVDDPALAARLH